MLNKIAIIGGAGNVGAMTAFLAAQQKLAKQIAIVDIPPKDSFARGLALDMSQATGSDVIGGSAYENIKDADVVVITAGLPRKPNMDRKDLVNINAPIMRSACENVKTFAPQSKVIVVANPMDSMCHVALETTGFPKNRVIGMGGILDSARYKHFIALALRKKGIRFKTISPALMGGHGNEMVPLPRLTLVDGKPLSKLLAPAELDEVVTKTRKGGAEIVGLLGNGSAYYAPASSVIEMIKLMGGKPQGKKPQKPVPCAVYLDGQYGIKNLVVGVPVELDENGVRKIVETPLTEAERQQLQNSAKEVQDTVDEMRSLHLLA
ncbi:MAG TPA: malate dehydrogenase [Coleofasciculaceae cyanobacterium]|jgi:malate dehydrogenase